jgi:hypothetical protein
MSGDPTAPTGGGGVDVIPEIALPIAAAIEDFYPCPGGDFPDDSVNRAGARSHIFDSRIARNDRISIRRKGRGWRGGG